ncbi:Vacuolar membrane protease [Cladochytrium tenue]|nr:Vacuolar membrane protease [Cladochytrium tenue]
MSRAVADLLKFYGDLRSKSIWSAPMTMAKYFGVYISGWFRGVLAGALKNKALVASVVFAVISIIAAYTFDGAHRPLIEKLERQAAWFGWWVILGIASSIGLGTGLHTFVLFLGPYIAKVTLAAYKCNGLDFDDRGHLSFVCHSVPEGQSPNLLKIYSKVAAAVFFWGLGTSIGELPPYFIARAAAVAGRDDPEFSSIERILERRPEKRSLSDKAQVLMYMVMKKLGFFGILLCASVPNPLFDLAGIICGHFSVPFMKFWGATMVGKALIKNTVQSFSIVVLFSHEVLEGVLSSLHTHVPAIHELIKTILDAQMRQFGNPTAVAGDAPITLFGILWNTLIAGTPITLFGILWNTLIAGTVGYFALSLVEALAMQEIRRQQEADLAKLIADEAEAKAAATWARETIAEAAAAAVAAAAAAEGPGGAADVPSPLFFPVASMVASAEVNHVVGLSVAEGVFQAIRVRLRVLAKIQVGQSACAAFGLAGPIVRAHDETTSAMWSPKIPFGLTAAGLLSSALRAGSYTSGRTSRARCCQAPLRAGRYTGGRTSGIHAASLRHRRKRQQQ